MSDKSQQILVPTEQSSVTLTRNAKGGVQPEVKVYDTDPTRAQQKATEIFDALCSKYPHAG